jgi:hypothetical protein
LPPPGGQVSGGSIKADSQPIGKLRQGGSGGADSVASFPVWCILQGETTPRAGRGLEKYPGHSEATRTAFGKGRPSLLPRRTSPFCTIGSGACVMPGRTLQSGPQFLVGQAVRQARRNEVLGSLAVRFLYGLRIIITFGAGLDAPCVTDIMIYPSTSDLHGLFPCDTPKSVRLSHRWRFGVPPS